VVERLSLMQEGGQASLFIRVRRSELRGSSSGKLSGAV